MDSENFNVKFGEVINTGAGTTDFNSLTNRPKYNNVKMTGNTNIPKVPTATSELTNDSGFITSTELGTETTAREQADNALQGQINTKADKSTTYTKTETDNLVNGAIGEVKVLTTEDYNWPADNPTGIAPWLLDLGWYTAEDDVKIFFNPTLSTTTNWHYGQSFYIGKGTGPGGTQYQMAKYMYRIGTYGVHPTEGYGAYTWITWFAKDNSGIQMVMFPSFADLSARVTRKAGAPTTSTEGVLGQLWEDSTGGDLYQLKTIDTSVTPNVYTWEQVGGSSINVVQTTGTSTTDVMSQNAVTLAVADKQDTLTAGSNITIDANNEISATDTTYTAGTNVSISSGNVISATDTTYSDFVGTDGQTAGTAGLVPAPATTDAGKFLKADGTWDTAGGGSGPTVVQTTGTSTTDVMSQNATTSMVFADPADKENIRIGGTGTASSGRATAIGRYTTANKEGAIAISGGTANTTSSRGEYSISIGEGNDVSGNGAVSLGSFAPANSVVGKIEVGTTFKSYGYNNSNYRLLTGLYDPQNAHDAANKEYVDGKVLTAAGAPTTATVGTVGQLYEDSTNGKLYICTDATNPYVWSEVGAGGGGGVTVVQTTGTSTTDVMSQNATTSMVYADPSAKTRVQLGSNATAYADNEVVIGAGANSNATNAVAVGSLAIAGGNYSTAIGPSSNVAGASNYSAALGYGAYVSATKTHSVAIGSYSKATEKGQVDFSTFLTTNTYGYNNSQYRLLTGLYDPQNAHDAANKEYVDSAIIRSGTAAPTTSTAAAVGALMATVESGTGHLYICTDDTGGTYIWQTLV